MFAILLALSLSQIKRQSASRYSYHKKLIPKDMMDESVVCKVCLDVIDMIDELLQNDKLEEEIIQTVDEYCQKLPSPYSSLCVAYVESGIPLAISYIKEGIDTFDICGKLKLCDPTMASSFPHNVRRPRPNKNIPRQVTYIPFSQIKIPQSGYKKVSGCEMCNALLEYFQQLISEKTVEEEINSLALDKCKTYNSPYSTLCRSLVQQYSQYISVWVEGKISNNDICTRIGLCDK